MAKKISNKEIIKRLMAFVYEVSECRWLGDGEYECPWKTNEPPNERASRIYTEFEKEWLSMPQYAAGPWLPMSEAPRDGIEVLVQRCVGGYIVVWHRIGGWCDREGNIWASTEFLSFAYINKPEVRGENQTFSFGA